VIEALQMPNVVFEEKKKQFSLLLVQNVAFCMNLTHIYVY